ncbi:hypothetical protein [Verrucomicrobium spinosum]|uniref:hypothetical protein n=1 Tax=Verrucomicrobium spinosum TaxID=2736 RepID=UPI0001745E8E|nr:hypothetical protein [Verrucomicrobium spinosum]
MSANAIFTKSLLGAGRSSVLEFLKATTLVVAVFALFAGGETRADEADDSEAAIIKLAEQQEKLGFDFRADIWQRELKPDLGKAVRIQLFKGNEYRVCVAVPPKSGVQIAAHVLDAEGKPVESKVEASEGGWGVTLHVTPKRTGVFMVAIRRSGGKDKATICAMISGYK